MLKIGLFGAGHLGKIHINCIKASPEFELIGFYDSDPENAALVAAEFGILRFQSAEELIDAVEVVDIVTPTISHYDIASQALKKFRHVFIEKPIVSSPEEALKLIGIASEANVKVQVGHVERFNPAFIAARSFIQQPMFIETHRLAQFNPRGTDVPVILDLMIHDIDIVLNVVKSGIRKISASGVAIISDTPDIANARLEFDNGCVANLTASRISMKDMRKSRFFQRDAYISVDFLKKETEIIRLRNIGNEEADPLSMIIELPEGKGSKQIYFDKPKIIPLNAIQTELQSFAKAITHNKSPLVTINDGYLALDVATRITEHVNNAINKVK